MYVSYDILTINSIYHLVRSRSKYIKKYIGDRMKLFSQKQLLRNGLVFLLFGCVAHTSFAQQNSSYELWKGVVVDSNNKLIYAINPNGGIDGIDIIAGKKVWHTDHADRPIVVQGSNIIAQRDSTQPGEISLVGINNKTGAMNESHSVLVNKDVVARVGDGLNQHFDIKTKIVNASLSHLEWQFRKEIVRGTAPENNTININNTISKTNKSSKPIFGEISFNNNSRLVDASSRMLSQKLISVNTAIEGKFLSDKKGRQFKSISGYHIMVSNLKSDPSLWKKYHWDIYDLSGELLGSINNASSYISFNVVDDVILFMSLPNTRYIQSIKQVEPLLLQAYSLNSGKMIWKHDVKDLTYKGPYPQ